MEASVVDVVLDENEGKNEIAKKNPHKQFDVLFLFMPLLRRRKWSFTTFLVGSASATEFVTGLLFILILTVCCVYMGASRKNVQFSVLRRRSNSRVWNTFVSKRKYRYKPNTSVRWDKPKQTYPFAVYGMECLCSRGVVWKVRGGRCAQCQSTNPLEVKCLIQCST